MPRATLIAVGELLVEFVSHREDCDLHTLSEYSGPYPSGAPAICIDQAARIGAQSWICGAVGNDNFGRALVDRLQCNGVDTSGIASIDDKTTGVAFVSYFADGSRTFIFHLNNTAADALPGTAVTLPPGPLIMHVSGSSLGNPRLRAAIEAAVSQVEQLGGQISCDPNVRPELMRDTSVRTTLLDIIGKSHFLFPSDQDLDFLYPDRSHNQAIDALLDLGVDTIALTRGERGCVIYRSNGSPLQLAGHKVQETDPTGAGDCFCGTFLAMIAQGHALETSARYANAAGAIAVTRRGPMEGNSSMDDIETFMQQNPAASGVRDD